MDKLLLLKSKYICIIISLLPLVFLAVNYHNLALNPNTKIIGNNGITVSKPGFFIIISCLCVLWYGLARFIYFEGQNSIIPLKVNKNILRILVNLFLSALSFLLILSNLS